MKKYEALHGRGAFDKVFASGARIQGSQIRCVYRLRPMSGPAVRIGFSVPRQSGNAVLRNRVRRLMREVMAHQLAEMKDGLSESRCSLDVVVAYRIVKGRNAKRLTLFEVEEDMAKILRQIVKSADRFRL